MRKSFPWINYLLFVFANILFFFSLSSNAQPINKDNEKKFSPLLIQKIGKFKDDQVLDLLIVTTNRELFLDFLNRNHLSVNLSYEYRPAQIFAGSFTWKDVVEKILPLKEVVFIDEKRIPVEELLVGDYDLGTNKVNTVHSSHPQWNGNTMVLSIKENKPDTTDIDLKGRYIPTNLASPTVSAHATIMSTIAAGGGNSFYLGKGAAWGSNLTSSNYSVLLPDSDAAFQQYNISVQNHSYGTSIENYYGAEAVAYDMNTRRNPYLLHVFSAGNAGNITSNQGNYSGIPAHANLTGNFKMAKNIITVGHIDSFGNVLLPSSKGPAYDGRIKPELVAFGEDGSSGAAALVSGISILLQQAYKELNGNNLPSSALLKGILINSADDVASPGIDFKSGFGSANAFKAMRTLVNGNYMEGSVSNGSSQNFNLTIPAGIRQLKLTLVWNDSAGSANSPKALVNDLDLKLELPSSGQSWYPWVLNSFPHLDSLNQLPVRRRDSLNNIEQVSINNPVAGSYNIRITGNTVASSSQNFFIAWQLDTMDTFIWFYPTNNDNIFSARTNMLRWESNFGAATGQLAYSTDGSTWQAIDNAVDLAKGFYRWVAPDIFSPGLFRMTINAQQFSSDTFTFSKPLTPKVGFNCNDSFLIYWNKAPAVANYQLYRLGQKWLEPFVVTSDTLIVLNKISNPGLHYAVAPIVGNKSGVKSLTFNYTTQGVGCYLKSFLAVLNDNIIQLQLELGTLYKVQSIVWEKLTTSGFTTISQTNLIGGLQFVQFDIAPQKGVNTYRVKIQLDNGNIIYSQPETVYYFGAGNYIVFPNPARQFDQVTILNKDANLVQIQIFNSTGAKVFEKELDDVSFNIPRGKLSRGLYLIRLMAANKSSETIRLIVY